VVQAGPGLPGTVVQAGPGLPGAVVQAGPPPADEVLIQSLPEPVDVRRASDMFRLIIALVVLVCAGLVAALDDAHVRLTERDLLESIVTLPAALRDWLVRWPPSRRCWCRTSCWLPGGRLPGTSS
jgi:hypothetical protein